MSIQAYSLILAIICSLGAATLAVILWIRDSKNSLFRAVSAMVLIAAGISLAGNLAMRGGDYQHWWAHGIVFGQLLQIVALSYLVWAFMCHAEGPQRRVSRRKFHIVLASSCMAAAFLLAFNLQVFQQSFPVKFMELAIKGVHLGILVGLIVGLARLEGIFRALRDPFRYQAKFVLIGIGGIAAYEVYQASEWFLLSTLRVTDFLARGLVVMLCIGLIAFGFGRIRVHSFAEKIYLSPQVLSGSISTIIIGLYLLTVGAIAQWINTHGGDVSTALSIALVFWALLALVVGVASRDVRARLRLFVARHFYRSKYDYREKWLELTNTFHQADSTDTILDRLRDLLGQTFSAARISVWLRYDADQRFHEVRSVHTALATRPRELSDPLVSALLMTHDPMPLSEQNSMDDSADLSPISHKAIQAALGIPIWAGGELMAFIVMSKEVSGEEYQADDIDLLRVMARHVGVLLANAKLAEERTAAAELEALHRFSAFCLHDLKNLAARLSLVLQNAEVHGHNPEFQKSALKTMAGTVSKITGLITKLSLPQVPMHGYGLADLNQVVRTVLAGLSSEASLQLACTLGEIPPVRINQEQIQAVLENLILNARQAGGAGLSVHITTNAGTEEAVITLRDAGPGIAPEHLRKLFQPFQTTKAEGLGIGLYQCRKIIEAHGGKIRINSQLGQGTTVRIELPSAAATSGTHHRMTPHPGVTAL